MTWSARSKPTPEAFGDSRVWIDYGEEDDLRVYHEGSGDAMRRGGADLTAHSWPGDC